MFLIILFTLLNINSAFIHFFPNIIDTKLKIIEYNSLILPKIDIFGHKILEENRLLIHNIIHTDNLSIEVKKELILFVIKITQMGDNFGNIVLTNYEHLVHNLL